MTIFDQPWVHSKTDDVYGQSIREQLTTENSIKDVLEPYTSFHQGQTPSQDPSKVQLLRAHHIKYLLLQLFPPSPRLPQHYESMRQWHFYWNLNSLDLLGHKLDQEKRRRCIETILSFQNPITGGFGGGPRQIPHVASSYAAISALSTLLQDEEDLGYVEGVWGRIDRRKMYEWLLTMKQPDGSFLMHEKGEVDVRASYAALVCATVLNFLTPEFVRGQARYIASCQNYEGGLSAASFAFPGSSFLPSSTDPGGASGFQPNPSLGESHGGYTFCALSSHWLLLPVPSPLPLRTPSSAPEPEPKDQHGRTELDVRNLLRWSVQIHGNAIEGGGFRGRFNKLVDGCYSWWVGGLFTTLDALLRRGALDNGDGDGEGDQGVHEWDRSGVGSKVGKGKARMNEDGMEVDEEGLEVVSTDLDKGRKGHVVIDDDGDEEWVDEESEDQLYDRVALQEYILLVAQQPGKGGLRDKPDRPPDAYHTNYNLCGLSISQHRLVHSTIRLLRVYKEFRPPASLDPTGDPLELIKSPDETDVQAGERMRNVYAWNLGWKESVHEKKIVGNAGNEIGVIHPNFGITMTAYKRAADFFYRQGRFARTPDP